MLDHLYVRGLLSPTGQGIRNDSEGSGEYGAPRGTRLHNGLDFICAPGQEVIAPFNMKIKRVANPKAHSPMSGIEWIYGKSSGKMFYFKPDPQLIGKSVSKGDVIGIAQNVAMDYGLPNMIPHVHFQID